MMKKKVIAAFLIVFIFVLVSVSGASSARQLNGAELYKKHCSGCHHSAAKFSLGVNILGIMRRPPPGMPLFDSDKIPDINAHEIVSYIELQIVLKLMCKA